MGREIMDQRSHFSRIRDHWIPRVAASTAQSMRWRSPVTGERLRIVCALALALRSHNARPNTSHEYTAMSDMEPSSAAFGRTEGRNRSHRVRKLCGEVPQ